MTPWFVLKYCFLGAGYELVPGDWINSCPRVVRIQKLCDLGLC